MGGGGTGTWETEAGRISLRLKAAVSTSSYLMLRFRAVLDVVRQLDYGVGLGSHE